MNRRTFLAGGAALAGAVHADDWPQAAGPERNWQSPDRAPVRWSVARHEQIVWRTALPEAGQSGIAVAQGRVFLTTMKPLPDAAAKKEGSAIVGYCLDARSGKILWSVDLPGSLESPYAYGFSDSSSPTPVTDGRRVWFVNASGAMACCDFRGKTLWRRTWAPTAADRPFNKQFEPILTDDGVLLHVEPRDPDDPKREADPWNYVRGLDARTGKTLWVSDDALTHYNAPVAGRLPRGGPALLIGRGGYHDVPEAPPGLSLVDLRRKTAGKTLWRYEAASGKALYNMCWDSRFAYWLDQDRAVHVVLDAATGRLVHERALTLGVDWRRFDPSQRTLVTETGVDLSKRGIRVFPAWFTNIVVENWHYFLCFTDPDQGFGPPHAVGRVNVVDGRVEYLEVPTAPGVWGQPQSASTVNSRGIDVASDPRSKRDGWFWCFLGNPVALDGKLYWTTMCGVTYVLDARARVLDEKALLAVNDLGPLGETWSLNSVALAGGRLYHRSMREALCIGR